MTKPPPASAIDRHTPIGLFNFAASWQAAADLLIGKMVHATHPHAPVAFLYYQALELYLKAFLRHHKFSMKKLRRIGHNYIELSTRAEAKGLTVDSKQREIFQVLGEGDAWERSRYLEVGMLSMPEISELRRACSRLEKSVGRELASAGLPVRKPRARRI